MGVYFSRHSQLPMLVMEYLPLSLTQCLETHQDLPLQIKYSILLDVAKGLNYLHCKRPPIVHRDLTANNILLTSNFIAKISDLGVSRMADTFKRQQLTKAPGNAIVMPPEALKDNPTYDHKLDVFSYGCLILHVFTHQWPVPTDQFVPSTSFFRRKSYDLVTEWNRRSKYTTAISSDNPFFSFTKSCLDNDPKKRPTINDAITCAQHAVSNLAPLKNTMDMMKDVNLLTERVNQLERQVEQERKQAQDNVYRLEKEKEQTQDIVHQLEQEKKQAEDCAHQLEQEKEQMLKDVLRLEENVKQLEVGKHYLASVLVKFWQAIVTNDVHSATQEKDLAIKSNLFNQEMTRPAKLQSAISELEEMMSQCPSYQVQKEMIQHLLTQELKEGDEW